MAIVEREPMTEEFNGLWEKATFGEGLPPQRTVPVKIHVAIQNQAHSG